MNSTKKILSLFMIIFVLMAGLGMASPSTTVFAEEAAKLPWDKGATNGATATDFNTAKADAKNTAVGSIVGTMYKFATYISGLIFGVSVIMIVWAGFKYATSQGETKVTEQAKMQIITAGIGIGVALFAMIIVKVFAEIYNVS